MTGLTAIEGTLIAGLLAVALLAPFNIGLAATTAERGVLQLKHYRWLLLMAAEVSIAPSRRVGTG